MPTKRLQFGENAPPINSLSNTGVLQTTNLPTARPASAPIQTRRWGRNGKHPNAIAESMKSEAGNQAALFRTKQVFSNPGFFQNPAMTGFSPSDYFTNHGMIAGSGVCDRWRCAFHSGPYANFIDAEVYSTSSHSFGTANAFVQLVVTDVAANTTQTVQFATGALTSEASGLFDRNQLQTQRIFIAPDRDYTLAFQENGSDTIFACVAEFSSLTAYFGGYLPQNIAVNGPITTGYRQNVAQIARALWQRGGWPLGNWSVEDGTLPPTTTSTSYTNLIGAFVDPATATTTLGTTVIDRNQMGWMINTTGRARRSQMAATSPGIPVVLAVYGSSSVANSGFVQLVDEHGNVCVLGEDIFGVTPGWVWLQGFMPAGGGLRNYQLMFATEPTTSTSIYAASLYELG